MPLVLVERAVAKVPLANVRGAVAGRAKVMRDRALIVEQAVLVSDDAVRVRVGPGQELTTIGATDWRGCERLVKDQAFPRKPVNVRRADGSVSVARQRVVPELIREDEDDVRLRGRGHHFIPVIFTP